MRGAFLMFVEVKAFRSYIDHFCPTHYTRHTCLEMIMTKVGKVKGSRWWYKIVTQLHEDSPSLSVKKNSKPWKEANPEDAPARISVFYCESAKHEPVRIVRGAHGTLTRYNRSLSKQPAPNSTAYLVSCGSGSLLVFPQAQ